MANFTKSGPSFHRLPTDPTRSNSRDSKLTIGEDLESNPFDGKKDWDEFKKEYYAYEKKIKKGLESLHLVLIEFTKQISLADSRAVNNANTSKLFTDFQEASKQTKADLKKLDDLFPMLRKNKEDNDERIKQNMFKRFKEIHLEHEKEYSRLISSFDLNKKKLELFNETLKLGELNVEKKLGGTTVMMMQQNQDLAEAVAMSSRILNQANTVSRAFGSQQNRLSGINMKVKVLIEEFAGVSELMRKIKYLKFKRQMFVLIIIALMMIYLVYRIARRWL